MHTRSATYLLFFCKYTRDFKQFFLSYSMCVHILQFLQEITSTIETFIMPCCVCVLDFTNTKKVVVKNLKKDPSVNANNETRSFFLKNSLLTHIVLQLAMCTIIIFYLRVLCYLTKS
jgi:hypothetical protein